MSFFDDKEEVMDVQLTQFGKHLLSKGKFKPHYYAFFDNNILYDGARAGVLEEQNEIKERILNETPQLKTQYVFHSLEKDIKEQIELKHFKKKKDITLIQSNEERNYALPLALGTSDFNNNYFPAWNIRYLNGELSGSTDHSSNSENPFVKIPQLSSSISFETAIKDVNKPSLNSDFEDGMNLVEYPDGTYFGQKNDFILLDIGEENVPYFKDNFDIEVFEITSSVNELTGISYEKLLPLSFVKDREAIKDDLLVDADPPLLNEIDLESKFLAEEPSYVEHYFDIFVDEEIDRDLLCELAKRAATKEGSRFIDDLLQDCEDIGDALGDGIGQGLYKKPSDVYVGSEPKPEEDC